MSRRKPKPKTLKKLEGNPGEKKTEYEGAGVGSTLILKDQRLMFFF